MFEKIGVHPVRHLSRPLNQAFFFPPLALLRVWQEPVTLGDFQLSVESNPSLLCVAFALLRSVTGLKHSHQSKPASSPGVPPYYVMVRVVLWDRCTAAAFCILPKTPRAPCLPTLNRPLEKRQNQNQNQLCCLARVFLGLAPITSIYNFYLQFLLLSLLLIFWPETLGTI